VKPAAQSPAKSEPPSAKQTDPPVSQAQKYEQAMVQVKAKCTESMNKVLSDAETSIRQLDRTDPAAVREFQTKLMKELGAAESLCDAEFQEVSQKAEQDSVSPAVIEEWKQTFNALKEKLREESKAKLQQMMGG
jgi:hypothetical protein